ncbi:MAG TPA: SEC-C metal-binding domain-containing protein [Bryobacteraceae bacterium]|nr:SEC-C metal-binding domain-containing protein [Bryobacteraceae bacterium]
MSSTAVHHISPDSPPFEVGNLSPIQAQVVAALAQGRSVTRAAAAAGIHRSTIHNWIRSSKEFRDAVNQARSHFFECVNEQLNELSAAALDTLRQMLTSPDTPPSLRLHTALAVLERPGNRDPGWQVPLPVGRVMEPAPEPVVRNPQPPVAAIPASAPRNAPCPCGSGIKYKYCCGSPLGVSLGKLTAPPRPQG